MRLHCRTRRLFNNYNNNNFLHAYLLQECVAAHLLQTHITGVMVHGKTTFSMIDVNQYPHDSNLTLTCLLRSLWAVSTEGQLPPVLYVQADNCGRENKNRYIFSFLALLVAKRIVKEVLVSFLMVGHTHEGKAALNRLTKQLVQSTRDLADGLLPSSLPVYIHPTSCCPL